ncbi:MAG: methylmalonyl Co-A mutase-associated GTPase MeaB, partial [Archaeoglobaceae archaeon]|nr:methylmalonyl Co-A mutase-associated GTPase MeaB [Archaeoglobaceae archaeon]
ETVGTGQGEVGVLEVADTVVVILMPEMGDEIQVNKAGILEIGDIFVINKADLDGAENFERWLNQMLSLDTLIEPNKKWRRRVIKTVATSGKGIKELVESIIEHYDFLYKNGLLQLKRIERTKIMAIELAIEEIRAKIMQKYGNLLEKDVSDPYSIAEKIIKELIKF